MTKQELIKKITEELDFINRAYLYNDSPKAPRVILARDRIAGYQALASAMLLSDENEQKLSCDGVLCDKPI